MTPMLRNAIAPTVLLRPVSLSRRLGVSLTLAVETFQHTGSFKFRAAYNLTRSVPNAKILAASSGNFGQALAYACKLLNKACIIVMPTTSATVKVESVRSHGAMVDLIDTAQISREARLKQLTSEHSDAYVTNAYDDEHIIEGNATLGAELAPEAANCDFFLVPVGGGGLISGVARGLRKAGQQTDIVGAEPELANDAARSLRAGFVIKNESEPATIADGARTISVGKANWPIIQREVKDIVEVSEQNIVEAVRLLFRFANVKAEPTGALAVGALLEHPSRFHGRRVCCVISGGNVDSSLYTKLISGCS